MFLRVALCSILLFSTLMGFAQNGKILSKRLVDISKTPIWNRIAPNGELKPAFKHVNDLNFYAITYLSDSIRVKGIIVEPKSEGIYPTIILNRGGNRTFGQLTIGTAVLFASKLASAGYVIIGSNYRQEDEFGGTEINDVLNLFETIKEVPKADNENIGMLGWSRGGMMTYLALTKTDKIKTSLVGNGATDLFNTLEFRPGMETKVFAQCIPNYWENKEDELKKRSAIYWTEKLDKNCSLLILSGTKDQRVNPNQAVEMTKKLRAINYNVVHKTYETDHFFSDKKPELNRELINWFDSKLK